MLSKLASITRTLCNLPRLIFDEQAMSSSLSRISLESRMSADKSTTTRWLYTFQNSSTWKRNPSRFLQQRGTNLNLLHEGLSVQIHRGRGRFRSRGRAEFRANSDWNVRNERQLSRNRSYRIFVFKLRGEGEGSRSIRPRQDIATKLFPRTAPRVLLLKRIGYIGNVIDAPPLLLLACGYPSGVDLEAIMDEIRGSSLDRWRPILKGTKNIKWSFEIFERVLQKFWNQISIGTS